MGVRLDAKLGSSPQFLLLALYLSLLPVFIRIQCATGRFWEGPLRVGEGVPYAWGGGPLRVNKGGGPSRSSFMAILLYGGV